MNQPSTKQRLLYCFVAAVFITAICLATLGYLRSKNDRSVPVKSLKSPQQADAPLGFPLPSTGETPAFDSRFVQLTAFERATIPTATRMTAPMGTENGALTYNAQPYWSDNKKRGGHHTGDDFNGIGGMNTDLGDPVYAIANGLVVYRGEPSSGWGKTLILAHRVRDKNNKDNQNGPGRILLSMYAHLNSSYAPHGDLIHMGERIGTVGTANLNYPAHLHLELRDSTGVHIGPGYTSSPGESLSPTQIINEYTANSKEQLPPSPLAILLHERLQKNQKEVFSIK